MKLFLARNTSAFKVVFPDHKRKIPGNPEIPEGITGQEELNQ
jgi:hypothetical protein